VLLRNGIRASFMEESRKTAALGELESAIKAASPKNLTAPPKERQYPTQWHRGRRFRQYAPD